MCLQPRNRSAYRRRSDGTVSVGSRGIVAAIVAGGHHRYNACLIRRFHRPAERVNRVALVNWVVEREVAWMLYLLFKAIL